MKIITGLFHNDQDAKRAVSALDRHRFTDKDVVSVIDQSKISQEDATHDQEQDRLRNILTKLGISTQQARIHAESLKQDDILIIVRTDEKRASEAINLMRQANASETRTE